MELHLNTAQPKENISKFAGSQHTVTQFQQITIDDAYNIKNVFYYQSDYTSDIH